MLNHPDKIKVLKQVSFLNTKSETELKRFLEECQIISLEPGEVVFEEGSTIKTMYIVLSGEVEIYKENKRIASRKSSDFFGEMALLESKPRSASVRSCSDSLLLEIDKKQFETFFLSDPNIILEILKSLSSRSREELEVINWSFRELRKNEHRYRGIIETTSDVIIQVDPNGKIAFVNPAAFQLSYKPLELIGQPIEKFLDTDNKDSSFKTILTKRFGKRSTFDQEITLSVRDDLSDTSKKITLLISSFGLWDIPDEKLKKKESQNQFLGTAIIGRDITARKNAEESLIKAHDELEIRVKERTTELDKSNKALQDEVIFHKQTLGKLQTAKEEAERTSNAKSEFMARMSHELRTPLNAILGFSQLLSSNPLDMTSQQIEDIKIIEKAGGHLLNLVNDVLDLSSIEQGKMEIIKEDVSVRQMLEDVYLLIKPLAEKQNINIILPLTKNNDYKVFVDPQRFKQVLINLISNAVKYNRENGTVTIRCQKTPNNNIQIDIKDTGRGISLENQKQIFEPFNRGNSSKTQIEGTGIGLTITKYLVELMGGTITLKSQLDKGSYFSIKLPESKVSVPPISEAQNKPETVSSGIGSNQPFSILYIEDNTFSRKLIEEILLSRPDIRHLSSPNMKLGIKSAQQYHPDLILMDMNLPDIDGMEGIKILQSDPKTKNIPVIALSANALPNHIKEALEIGFKDYITKPLNIISFLELIDRHLSQK